MLPSDAPEPWKHPESSFLRTSEEFHKKRKIPDRDIKATMATTSFGASYNPVVFDDMSLELMKRRTSHASLPPPQQFHARDRSSGQLYRCKLLVDAKSPHIILSTSNELTDNLGFTKDQLCARSINVLCGPATDKMSLVSAIKRACSSAEGKSIEVSSLEIYGKDEAANTFKAVCTVYEKSDDGVPLSCSVLFRKHISGSLTSLGRAERASGCSSRNMPLQSARAEYRERYNFLTGIEMQRDLEREIRISRESAALPLSQDNN